MSGMKSMAAPTSNALRRIRADLMELQRNPSEMYKAFPLEDDVFQWHFTVRGPAGTEFVGGLYHGRILLPAEWPFKPPSIMLMTPNGRFEVNKKICLSLTAHHPEHWQPAWGIRTILEALVAFFPTPADGSIGALTYRAEERAALAKKSPEFECPQCGRIADILQPICVQSVNSSDTSNTSKSKLGDDEQQQQQQPEQQHDINQEQVNITRDSSLEQEATESIPSSPHPVQKNETNLLKNEEEEEEKKVEPMSQQPQDELNLSQATRIDPSTQHAALIDTTTQSFSRQMPAPFAQETRIIDSLIALVSALLLAVILKRFYYPSENWFENFI